MLIAELEPVASVAVRTSASSQHLIEVEDESMFNPGGEKSYRKGDFVTVDTTRAPRHKSTVVIWPDHEGPAQLKQLVIEPDGRKFLHSLNPLWPNRIAEFFDNAMIFGVVTGKWEAS